MTNTQLTPSRSNPKTLTMLLYPATTAAVWAISSQTAVQRSRTYRLEEENLVDAELAAVANTRTPVNHPSSNRARPTSGHKVNSNEGRALLLGAIPTPSRNSKMINAKNRSNKITRH